MNTVEPIRDRIKINAIRNNLKLEKNPRNYLLFVMGINSALRISDLLKLKIKDVIDNRGNIKESIYIRQKKTGKEIAPLINDSMREAIKYYLERIGNWGFEDYLFKSKRNPNRALERVMAWYLINKWCADVGLDNGRIGTHSLRKTWGYHARKAGIDLETIMIKLGQKSISSTKAYIGISQEEIGAVENKVCL